jgi:ATP-dependent Clp protease, protease subunit
MLNSLIFHKPAFSIALPNNSGSNQINNKRSDTNSSNILKMMPIGVPKVAYRVPGAPSADWVDIYNRLYRERIIFLGQEIDDEIANQIIAVMLYLDSEDNSKPIYLYINSPGGSVISGLAMYDTMKHIKSEVVTINVGLAASMSSFILAAGEKGKRLALPHSRIMIHQPMGGAQGQASDIEVEAQQILRIRKSLTEDYAEMSGRPYEKVLQDMDRDNFMSSYEAAEYGLIDRVIEGKAS